MPGPAGWACGLGTRGPCSASALTVLTSCHAALASSSQIAVGRGPSHAQLGGVSERGPWQMCGEQMAILLGLWPRGDSARGSVSPRA